MKPVILAALLVAVATALPLSADDAHHKEPAGAVQAARASTAGEVRKIDREAKKITLQHGPIQNLDMPAMTMVFQVKDPALLDRIKAGDKVSFEAERIDGALTVTRLAPSSAPGR